MKTIKLFKQDVYLKENPASVLEIRETKSGCAVILDQTVFFPAAGGQPCDTGRITSAESGLKCEIKDAYEESGLVYHMTENCPFHPGEIVNCSIDWGRRFDNMQRHCGEHILSGVFFHAFGGVNRGFHMGDDYMTIDINLEENPDYKEITWEMAMLAEKSANEVILSNAPVITRYFDSPAEMAGLPLRKAVAVDEDISIVSVGSIDNPADCVACCGTHPSSAGQVSLIKIYKVERYKNMFRIYFESGARALSDYDMKHDIISALNHKYSANTTDLLGKMALQDDKAKEVRNDLYALTQAVLSEKAAEIEAEINSGAISKIISKEFHGLKESDLMRLGRTFCNSDKLLLIISPESNTLLLFSDGKTFDCGKLVKENAPIYNGKGGGNSTSARVSFPNREYLDTFIDLIEKHLR